MTQVRNLSDLKVDQLVVEFNKLRLDMQKLRAGSLFHSDESAEVGLTASGTAPLLAANVEVIRLALNAHMASEVDEVSGVGVHLAADATNGPLSAAAGGSVAQSCTALGAFRTAFNAHLTQSGKHSVSDSANSLSSGTANPTDQATADAFATALVAKINLHFEAAFSSSSIEVVAC